MERPSMDEWARKQKRSEIEEGASKWFVYTSETKNYIDIHELPCCQTTPLRVTPMSSTTVEAHKVILYPERKS
eukprot:scaffold19519_cov69-Cylindrotheca_fusiformis.AAC.1